MAGDICGHSPFPFAPVNVRGKEMEIVKSYKHLGVHLKNKLDLANNTDFLVEKGDSRLFLFRRLGFFGLQGPLRMTFYDSVGASSVE